MEKIAVYGGSFDPPHKGHRLLAENLAEICGAKKVIIIPTALSPFKDSSSATPEERLEMCKKAFDSSLFEISDIEISRGGKSYTVDTLKAVKGRYPQSELFLFMGDDMLLSFDKWHKYREILSMAKIVCACRTAELCELKNMHDFSEKVLGLSKDDIIICKSVPIEISSSSIRADIDSNREYLNENVYEFIKARGLYLK